MAIFLRLVFVLPMLTCLLQAQSLELSFDIKQGANQNDDTLRIYIQSTTNSALGIRALNLSLAFDGGAQNMIGFNSVLSQSWTSFFERGQIDSVGRTYLGRTYNHRWSYGIADAILNSSTIVTIPADTSQALKILDVYFQSLAPGSVYLENELENPVNQIGDDTFNKITYQVVALPGAFPVEWAYLDARPTANGETLIEWGTLSETNNAWFEVERSGDKDFSSFDKLGQVTGKGFRTTEAHYSFVDKKFGTGRYYYRIRQVDYNGEFSFSSITSAMLGHGTFSIRTAPLPDQNLIKILFHGLSPEGYRLEFIDTKGLLAKVVTHTNPSARSTEVEVYVGDLSAGTYIIRAEALGLNSWRRTTKVSINP